MEQARTPPVLTRNPLRSHLETSVARLHLEFDLIAGDFTLISEFAEGPVRRERDFIAINRAILNRRFILRAGDCTGELRSVHLESKRVCSRRPVRRSELGFPF